MIIHARETSDGIRYRAWSSITDSYLTEPMDRDEAIIFLMRGYSPDRMFNGEPEEKIPTMLADAERSGRKFSDGSMKGPWKIEMCPACGTAHHAFDRRAGSRCGYCGEPESDRSHNPPCDPLIDLRLVLTKQELEAVRHVLGAYTAGKSLDFVLSFLAKLDLAVDT